ncbi:hypothetical protein ACFXKD_26145 [Nocardiopsis aegyptia]|uniref:hypothetical protein n=1 Tax=Nocardiopsis aegyptia TaxID=220378 RepID=UPI00366F7B60
MLFHSAPFVIGAVLLVLTGIGGMVCSFTAPAGRKALTGIGSALVLAAGLLFVVLPLTAHIIHGALAGMMGGLTAQYLIDAVDYIFTVGLGTGLILLALAATKRLSGPTPRFTPQQPYGPHAPGTPHQPGPAQG